MSTYRIDQVMWKFLNIVPLLNQSWLAVLYFNILTSDLYKIIRPNTVVSYADDSYVVVTATSRDELLSKFKLCEVKHYEWLKSIGMVCNTAKTGMMALGVDFEIEVENVVIKSSETMRALGEVMANKLSWELHVTKITQKCRPLLFALRYIRRHLEIPEIRFILNTHLVSWLSFSSLHKCWIILANQTPQLSFKEPSWLWDVFQWVAFLLL